jgi:hypothetical protein
MACQECGGDLYPDEGWYHVDGHRDDSHDAVPDDDDIDNDEYGQHRDPAAAYDEYKHRRADKDMSAGGGGSDAFSMSEPTGGKQVATSVPGAVATMGVNMLGINPIPSASASDTSPLNRGPMAPSAKTSLRHAARAFIASENTADRGELAYRAARYFATLTSTWPRKDSQFAVAAFVAAVEDEPCGGCNAESGEKCRPWCTGEQAQKNEKADKKHSHRTAAVVRDFDDSLLFGD